MKTIIALLAINFAAAVHADGFAPWETREISRNIATASTVNAAPTEITATGFAPWRTTGVEPEVTVQPEVQLEISENMGSVFRPWS